MSIIKHMHELLNETAVPDYPALAKAAWVKPSNFPGFRRADRVSEAKSMIKGQNRNIKIFVTELTNLDAGTHSTSFPDRARADIMQRLGEAATALDHAKAELVRLKGH